VLYFSCTLQKNVVRGALHLDLIHVSGRLPHTVSDQFKCVTILLDKCGTKTYSTSVLLEAIGLVLKQFCHSYLAESIYLLLKSMNLHGFASPTCGLLVSYGLE